MTEKILKEISKRFNDGTETIEDIIKYCRNYEIKFENGLELRVVEKKYFDKLVKKIKELEKENMQNDLEKIGIEENIKADMKEIIERYYTANEECIPKQKVKNVLDDIYDYFERLNGPDEDIEYIESKRKELLEEGE